jgi:16S rRNA processing protein RimM
MEDFIYIGRVANTHGVRGMMKILPTTDDKTRFELLEEVYIEDKKGNTKVFKISNIKYQKQFVLLQLEGINDMDTATYYKQGIVKIPKELALPLEEDEYYVSDLMGLEVYTEEDELLGKLKDIIFTGSNEVYVVDNGTKNGLLIPAIKDCIKDVNIDEGKIIVSLLEGLMD